MKDIENFRGFENNAIIETVVSIGDIVQGRNDHCLGRKLFASACACML